MFCVEARRGYPQNRGRYLQAEDVRVRGVYILGGVLGWREGGISNMVGVGRVRLDR